jgi:hypothetical protein
MRCKAHDEKKMSLEANPQDQKKRKETLALQGKKNE